MEPVIFLSDLADSLPLLPREEIQTQQRRNLSILRRKAKEVHGQERMELASALEPWEVPPTRIFKALSKGSCILAFSFPSFLEQQKRVLGGRTLPL